MPVPIRIRQILALGRLDATGQAAARSRMPLWPLAAGLVVAAAIVTATVRAAVNAAGGHLVYALDDAYIHMALARSLAQHGLWSVDGVRFAPASSSPLWTLLLAGAYRIGGVHQIWSLVLNLASGLLLFGVVHRIARGARLQPGVVCGLLISIACLPPLATLVLEGMEHVLQAALDVAFVASAVAMLTDPKPSRSARTVTYLLAPLVTGIRYEGAFLVAVVAAALVFQRRWHQAVTVAAMGALPVLLMAGFSVAHGGFLVPNSVLVKAQGQGIPDSMSIAALIKSAQRISFALSGAPHLLVLLIVSALLVLVFTTRGETWSSGVVWNGIFIATALIHLQFAAIGWFYRYESYLVTLGVVAIGISAPSALQISARPRWSVWTLASATAALCLVLQPLLWRAYVATTDTPKASANIYQQQIQMARFVDRYYPSTHVALNDIGAVAFLSRGRVVDLVGLADMRVARAKLKKVYDASFVADLARQDQVPIAIVYESWFPQGFPHDWRLVGKWSIPDPVVSGSTVSFFATRADEADRLEKNLRDFSSALPPQVIQSGSYTQNREQ